MRTLPLVVAALLLGGCSSDAPPTPEDSFDDVEVEVDDATGAIRGVVVDQSITPLADVKVVLKTDPPQEQTTDEQGRFVFNKLAPGFYLLNATKALYTSTQIQAQVEAGDAEPPVVRVQLTQLFSGEPFIAPFQSEGYFTCSQARMAGYLYSSSSCHDNGWGGFVGGASTDLSDYGVVLPQNRDFHADVEAGWQTMVFEMTWTPSAQGTSERMGMVVSTYKPERPTNHMFANVESANPMRFQLEVGEEGPGQQQGDGEHAMVPPDGLPQMSFFTSVRPPDDATCSPVVVAWCAPPGFALEQSFYVYVHQFYYLPAPEGWSIVAGDSTPY